MLRDRTAIGTSLWFLVLCDVLGLFWLYSLNACRTKGMKLRKALPESVNLFWA